MPIRFRHPGLKKTGVRSESGLASNYTGLSGGLHFKRNKFATNRKIAPHLKAVDSRQPGLRQASVPIRGLHSKEPQTGVRPPKSVSARAAARGGFDFKTNKSMFNQHDYDKIGKRTLDFNRNSRINPYR